MIRKFDSYEEAALFVQRVRAEGYDAEIQHEHSGFVLGVDVTGGFRVVVSDQPADEPAPPEEGEPGRGGGEDDLSTRVLRGTALLLLGVGAAVAIVSAILAIEVTATLVTGVLGVLLLSAVAGYFVFRRD